MNDTVNALILKQTDYRETDVILTVLTREYGKLSFVAAGARKMNSRNAGSILPYTEAQLQFDYKQGRTMFRMKTAHSVHLWRHLHEDLVLSAASAVLADSADLLSYAGEEMEGSEEMYDLLAAGMNALNEGKDPDTVLSVFIASLLTLHGMEPDVDECVHCGRKNAAAFSIRDGGFLCAQHAMLAHVPLSDPLDLKRFRLVVKAGMEHLDIVLKSGGAKRADLSLLIGILQQHGAVKLNAFVFYDKLNVVDWTKN